MKLNQVYQMSAKEKGKNNQNLNIGNKRQFKLKKNVNKQ